MSTPATAQTANNTNCPHGMVSLEQRLHTVRVYCEQHALRLTPLRQQVLELILAANQPLGAYDIMAQLSKKNNKPTAPPTVYRTLDFLLTHGFIHRLASSNSFVACCQTKEHSVAAFLICENCQQTQEVTTSELTQSVASLTNAVDFNVTQSVIEISGICQQCQSQYNQKNPETTT